jgi:hypothetical protein
MHPGSVWIQADKPMQGFSVLQQQPTNSVLLRVCPVLCATEKQRAHMLLEGTKNN